MAQIPGSARVNQYTATASQTVFTYDFKIYDDDEIKVQQNDDTLTLTTDYTVQDAGEDAGGTITLVTGATLNDIITLTGNSMIERDTVFTNGGDYLASAINGEYNKLDNIAKEITTDNAENFRLAVYSETVSKTIPTPSAGLALKWNATATALENSTYDPDTQQTAAAASAAAALVSEGNASDSEDAAGLSESAAASSASDASDSADEAAASAASINLPAVASDVVPDTNNTRYLGSFANRWKYLFTYGANFYGEILTSIVKPMYDSTYSCGTPDFRWLNGYFDNVETTTINGIAPATNRLVSMYSYTVASGESGGGITLTTWTTRPINTEDYDEIGITLASNQLTLPAGTYMHEFFFNYHYTQATSWGIYDISNSAWLDSGFAMFGTSSAGNTSAHSGVFTLAAETIIEVQQYSARTQATTGMGYPASIAAITEKHLSLKLTKLA